MEERSSQSPPSSKRLSALHAALLQAREMVQAAQKAIDDYVSIHSEGAAGDVSGKGVNEVAADGLGGAKVEGEIEAQGRRGMTSREMSGEMGGDTL